MSKLRIGYFADGPWSHRALERLLADIALDIRFICARNDRPDEELRRRAAANGIDFFTDANVNSDAFLARVDAYACDLFVSMSFNQIFRQRLRTRPRMETINCHAGKLPFYRGRNILNWALINDECEFGITVHYVDDGIDTGDIIAQRTYPIADEDTYATLLDRAYPACAEILHDAISQIRTGSAKRVPQREIDPHGFYCTARRPGDERLSWQLDSRAVFNFVRAICRPGPEARTLRGTDELRINRVQWFADAARYAGIPGAVLRVDPDGFLVKTGDSFVKVVEFSGVDRVRVGDRLQ
jgi:methionyl-tRNA formyltransferase